MCGLLSPLKWSDVSPAGPTFLRPAKVHVCGGGCRASCQWRTPLHDPQYPRLCPLLTQECYECFGPDNSTVLEPTTKSASLQGPQLRGELGAEGCRLLHSQLPPHSPMPHTHLHPPTHPPTAGVLKQGSCNLRQVHRG